MHGNSLQNCHYVFSYVSFKVTAQQICDRMAYDIFDTVEYTVKRKKLL